jgi:hypothetical protein
MASKTPKRAQEIRDLARALCIRAWLDTDWSEKTVYIPDSHSSPTVGNTVERVWLMFPSQGITLNIRFSSSLKAPGSHAWAGDPLVTSSYGSRGSRIEQIWWKMATEQKSFAGMGLLGTQVEIIARPSEEASAWAEEILAPYGIPPTAGIYEVTIQAPATAQKIFSGTCESEADARAKAMQDTQHRWVALEPGEAKIIGVKKVA